MHREHSDSGAHSQSRWICEDNSGSHHCARQWNMVICVFSASILLALFLLPSSVPVVRYTGAGFLFQGVFGYFLR